MNEEELKERLDFLEFRQELLFSNSDVDRILFEYRVKRNEYRSIMDIMDFYREKIEGKKKVNKREFENEIYEKVPDVKYNHHFCEYITKAFMEDGRWEEVFPVLYGVLPKYENDINKNYNE